MSDVIHLDEYRPHYTGEAICEACGHIWCAVVPTGNFWFECPKCKSYHGMPRSQIMRYQLHWACGNCYGIILAVAEKDGFYCVKCGKLMEIPA